MAEPGKRIAIEPNAFYFREIDLIPSYSCGPEDTREALNLIAEGGFPWRQLITHRFPLAEAPEAFRKVQQATDALKVIVEFPA
jgi:L-iditol 2-dehydrogenase